MIQGKPQKHEKKTEGAFKKLIESSTETPNKNAQAGPSQLPLATQH
jgi:hypothetical protein